MPAIATRPWCKTSAFWSRVDGNWAALSEGKLFFDAPWVAIPCCDVANAVISVCIEAGVTDALFLSSFIMDVIISSYDVADAAGVVISSSADVQVYHVC